MNMNRRQHHISKVKERDFILFSFTWPRRLNLMDGDKQPTGSVPKASRGSFFLIMETTGTLYMAYKGQQYLRQRPYTPFGTDTPFSYQSGTNPTKLQIVCCMQQNTHLVVIQKRRKHHLGVIIREPVSGSAPAFIRPVPFKVYPQFTLLKHPLKILQPCPRSN